MYCPFQETCAGSSLKLRQQCHHLRLISGIVPIIRWSSVLEMVFGQNILRIRREHLRWKTPNFLLMECVTFLDPEQYRTTNTVLLKILRFEGRLMFVDFQTLLRTAKVPLDIDILSLISLPEFPSLAILLPRYTNSSTSSEALLLVVTDFSFLPLILMRLVLVMLLLRPICFPNQSLAFMSWRRRDNYCLSK